MEDNRNFGVIPRTRAENRPLTPRVPSSTLPVLPAFPGLVGVNAVFTTRHGGFSTGPYASLNLGFNTGDEADVVRANWEALLRTRGFSGHADTGADSLPVIPRLCHGATLLDADDARAVAAHDGADAVFTRVRGRVIAVTTADCLAALVVDPVTGCAAAVHAGWRGTRENILGRTVARLFSEGLCRPATTHVALGPCLSTAALEIGDDVAAALPRVHVVRLAGRPHFDLRGCNHAQVVAAGVPAAHIAAVGGCTRGEPDLYFSHRGEQGMTGRMAACIALT